ncbi:MAG TPA: YdcF family protein [Actinomycetales bacterium]|nr:YdcF family protein [Actinomycetales bacterium]
MAIPPELLPPSLDVAQAPPVDPVGAGVIVADYLGDAVGRDALLAQLPGQRRAAVAAVLGAIHDPVATPDYANPSTHLTILGGGVLADGTLPAKVVQRMETGLAEANAHPSVPVLVTGGDTGNGVTEASSMRRWLLDNGVADERIIAEDRSWTTLSNAAESRRRRAAPRHLPGRPAVAPAAGERHRRRGAAHRRPGHRANLVAGRRRQAERRNPGPTLTERMGPGFTSRGRRRERSRRRGVRWSA